MYWRPFRFHIGLVDGCVSLTWGCPIGAAPRPVINTSRLAIPSPARSWSSPHADRGGEALHHVPQAGVEFIYMLTGTRALSPRRQGLSASALRRSILRRL